MDDIPAESVISQELGPGERLLWSGFPKRGIYLRMQDAFLIPFSLMWGGFAIFWEYSVISHGAPWFFDVWGIPFVLVGIYLIAGRFYFDALSREKTFYGVTNQRLVIISGVFSRKTNSTNLRTLTDISLTSKKDGSGNISFGPLSGVFPRYFTNPLAFWQGGASSGFETIPNAKAVYDLIHQAQTES
jgi:hypothetical protein